MTILKGSFISVWNDGTIQTEGTLDTKDGSITCDSVDTQDYGILEREFFEDKDGNEYEVCMTCHSYILKTAMVPEEQVCSDPDCESHEEE